MIILDLSASDDRVKFAVAAGVLRRVAEHLSTYVLTRRVDRSGLVSVYNRGRHEGKAHQGESVHVTYDPERNEWTFAERGGRQLDREPAEELSRERVTDLNVTHRRQGC